MNKNYYSIIIPTLNEEKYLPRLLTSLSKQNHKNFEIIIVDGNSQDKTKEKAKEFNNKFDIYFFENSRKNVAYQRNFGANKAKGDYLVFLDADAGILPTFIKKLDKFITSKKGLVFVPYMGSDRNDTQTKMIFSFINVIIETSQNVGKPFSAGGAIVFERNFFNKIGGFNEKVFISEDHELIQRAFKWGIKAKFMKGVKVNFSLRRMKKEGRLQLFYKYAVAAAHVVMEKEITNKSFKYEMGGQFYKNNDKKISQDNFDKYLSQVKTFFKKIITD